MIAARISGNRGAYFVEVAHGSIVGTNRIDEYGPFQRSRKTIRRSIRNDYGKGVRVRG